MKNSLGREGLNRPYQGLPQEKRRKSYRFNKAKKPILCSNWEELLDALALRDGMTLSFHHHLRNGDYVLNQVMEAVHKRGVKDLTLAASAIFPTHAPLVSMLEDGTVTSIYASYLSGPVAEAISQGKLKKPAWITTHGGRPRSILEGELVIDVAFLAAPGVDQDGAMSGSLGPSACGSLGYAVSDAQCAKKVVAVSDHLVEGLEDPDIPAGFCDYILQVDRIGDPAGIVSGTTQVTKDPLGLKIAREAAKLIDATGLIQDGFSFQTGAGGISLAVAKEVKERMIQKKVHGSFGCGGITGFFVDMLEEGLFDQLEDVQCFDQRAVDSIAKNPAHHKISASLYANPCDDCFVEKLDCVILGASEIDLDFNVNVTTGSDGKILGGSGGHADTATGAKLSIITTKLFNARLSAIVDQVRTITTPGEVVDAVVTEYGIAINPRREDLIERLKEKKGIQLRTIEELYQIALSFTGKPKRRPRSGRPVAYSVYRDGTILDSIDQVETVEE